MILIPFGDPNAHGSFAGCLSFRRIRGGVVLERKPRPIDAKTPAQLANRTAFTNANLAWYSYDVLSKPYINARATQLTMTARNLFVMASMEGILPVGGTLAHYGFNSVQMVDPTGRTSANTEILFYAENMNTMNWDQIGTLDIDTNVWTDLRTPGQIYNHLDVIPTTSVPFDFRFLLATNYEDSGHVNQSANIALPGAWYDLSGGANLYLSADFSLWTELGFTHWITTTKF